MTTENKDLLQAQPVEIQKILLLDTTNNVMVPNVTKVDLIPEKGLVTLSLGHTGIQIVANLTGFGMVNQDGANALIYMLDVMEPQIAKLSYDLLDGIKKAQAEQEAKKATLEEAAQEEKVELKKVDMPKVKATKKVAKADKKKKK